MGLKQTNQLSFADLSADKRKCKNIFFEQINRLIDWKIIDEALKKYYAKGMSVAGREEVNDRITFSKFCGLAMDSPVPDHSVLSRFRTVLTHKKALDRLFKVVNDQLSDHGILVKNGAAVDASITQTARKPKGQKTYQLEEDGSLDVSPSYQKGVDQEANWTKKRGTLYYGYKKHVAVETKEGLVIGLTTTQSARSDSKELVSVLDELTIPPKSRVYTDKGYSGKPNEELLKQRGLSVGIQKKARKNQPLTRWEKRFNHLVSKKRYKVERFFGSVKLWFRSHGARYIGLAKMHTQHVMEAIAYNLYRSPNIFAKGFTG